MFPIRYVFNQIFVLHHLHIFHTDKSGCIRDPEWEKRESGRYVTSSREPFLVPVTIPDSGNHLGSVNRRTDRRKVVHAIFKNADEHSTVSHEPAIIT
ncbi:hypothetical protein J6590_005371 [Homalodisca vitripennis]|nr:hypothetical protein J6590_005371 [Homalodisca vitripennis]